MGLLLVLVLDVLIIGDGGGASSQIFSIITALDLDLFYRAFLLEKILDFFEQHLHRSRAQCITAKSRTCCKCNGLGVIVSDKQHNTSSLPSN